MRFGTILGLTVFASAPVAATAELMPPAQVTAVVRKYCAVCHNDAHLNGGLTLEHFDAAHAAPGLMAMLLSKVKDGGAIGAAGLARPDQPTQDALIDALTAEAAGANSWTATGNEDSTTLSIVRKSPSTKYPVDDVYRLTITCQADAHKAQMLLSWAPGVPAKNQVIHVAWDENAPLAINIEGSEKRFRGATGGSGTGATILATTSEQTVLPAKSITISDLFPGETVVFPFDSLPGDARQYVARCFQ